MSTPTSHGLEPIEPNLRTTEPIGAAELLVRGGPLRIDKLVEHATRQARRYSYGDKPMYSISVDATDDSWTLNRILRDRLWSRSTYATCRADTLRDAGFRLLATYGIPHHDILLANGEPDTAATLLALFGAGEINPFKRPRR